MSPTIYHMAHAADWEAAKESGAYQGSAHDIRDGFIHFSTGEHIAASAAKHRAGQSDLLLISCDAEALGEALKWEVSRSDIAFPHLYRSLDPAEALDAVPLPLDAEGRHIFPKLA